MAKQQVILGLKCKMYVGAAGLTFSQLVIPGNEAKLIRDVTFNLEKSQADVTVRGSEWRAQVGVLKTGSVEGQLLVVKGNPQWEMFNNAFLNDVNLSVFVSDGQGEGLFGDWSVLNLSQPQPLEDVVQANFTISPTITDRAPQWMNSTVGQPPEITSSPSASGTVGTPFTFAPTADPAATTWAAKGLPAGLAISATTGEITGTPTAAGVFQVLLTATNSNGSTMNYLQIAIEE